MLAIAVSVCLMWMTAAVQYDSLLHAAADGSNGIVSDGVLNYRRTEGMSTVSVVCADTEIAGSLVIPSEYDGMKVVEIEIGAFAGQSGITDAVIPDTVQKIGAEAFKGCSSLETVSLENTLQSVGADAFAETAWSAAHSEDQMMIMDEILLVSVSDSAMNIVLPDTVRVVADEACMGNTSLMSAELAENTGYVGKKSFFGCSALTSVIIPSNVKNIDDYAFGESALATVVIPSTVLSIGKGAFIRCTQLQQVTIREGLLKIGSSAFSECTSLREITVPDSTIVIGTAAFSKCTGMQYAAILGGMTELPDDLFKDCTSLYNVVLDGDIVRIGSGAFNKCTALQSVTLPDTVKYIGSEAFQSCMSLRNVNIPESVIDIGVNAFFDTTFYNSLRASDSDSSFVIYDGRVLLGYYGEDQYLQIPDGIQVIGGAVFAANETISVICLPDTVTSISSYAFDNLWTLEQVVSTGSIEYIGAYAFWDCISLREMTFPEGVVEIQEGTMFGCESLGSVLVSSTVETICQFAFSYSGLESIVLPETVSGVESGAFEGCGRLAKIRIENPECALAAGCIPAETEIWGYGNSTAYYYAKEHGNPFVDISNSYSSTSTGSATATTSMSVLSTTSSSSSMTTTTVATSTSVSTSSNTVSTTVTTGSETSAEIGTLVAGTVEISISELENSDYSVVIPVSAEDTGGWYALCYGFSYDPAVLTAERVYVSPEAAEEVAAAEGELKNFPVINAEKGIVWDSVLPSVYAGVSCPDGVFAYIEFTVDRCAKPGDVFEIKLLVNHNDNYQEIETEQGAGICTLVDGAIIISGGSNITTTSTSATTTTTTATMTTNESTRTTTMTTTTTTTAPTWTTTTTMTTTATTPTWLTTTTTTMTTKESTWTTTTIMITTTTTPTWTTMTTTATTTENVPGDVNGDGSIGLNDSSYILSTYAFIAANIYVTDEQAESADVDMNSVVDLDDAQMLLRYYAGVGAGLIDQSFEKWRDAQ